MSVTGFLGMRGTGDWATDQRPLNWRGTILRLFPSGSAPLTAIMSQLKSEKTDDPQFHWWDKILADQGGAVTDVYIDALSTSYVYATHQSTYGTTGGRVYVNVSATVINHFRIGHQVVLRDADRSDVDVIGTVESVIKNGASSYLLVQLDESDDNSSDSSTYNLATVDRVMITGNDSAEGAEMPDSISYDPNKRYNYTSITRNSLKITRTAQETRLRTGDAYNEEKMETLQYHGVELDRKFIFSERRDSIDPTTGEPLRKTRGILNWIRSDSDAVNSDFRIDSAYAGKTWLNGGEEWLDTYLEQIFRYNESRELMGLCGSGFQLGLNRLAKTAAQIKLEPMDTVYGLQVTTWLTSFGRVQLITDPLFSHVAEDRYRCIIGDPRRLKYRYITDTMFKKDRTTDGGANSADARKEEFLTEAGLELHHSRGWGHLNGANSDNVV